MIWQDANTFTLEAAILIGVPMGVKAEILLETGICCPNYGPNLFHNFYSAGSYLAY